MAELYCKSIGRNGLSLPVKWNGLMRELWGMKIYLLVFNISNLQD